jgi:hypothetical protein
MLYGTFTEDGRCTSVSEFMNPGAIEMPGFTYTLSRRYQMIDGVIADLHPGKSDDEVFADEQAAAVQQAVAARQAKLMAGFPSTLDGKKAAHLHMIRTYYAGVIARIKADVAAYELETWDIQREEYVRYLIDPAAPTPYVDGLCFARTLDKAALMEKIGNKVRGLAVIQGTQHMLEKSVEEATTVEQLDAITLPS